MDLDILTNQLFILLLSNWYENCVLSRITSKTNNLGFVSFQLTWKSVDKLLLSLNEISCPAAVRVQLIRSRCYIQKTFDSNYDTESWHSMAGHWKDLLWCVTSLPRHVPQYVDDSVSNVFHLPAVDYRVQRWIKKYESQWESRISF